MPTDVKYIEIGESTPELLRLAEAVERSGVTHVLTRGDEDLAIVQPAKRSRRARNRFKRLGPGDPYLDIVGVSDREGPTDVSENVDAYLAEAYHARTD